MEQSDIGRYHVYKDIKERTQGDIYLGVIGPVRTGKSTFIRRFMELLVLPNMLDETERERVKDELPQAGSGKMIMTTEPKFVPGQAAEIQIADISMRIRLVDCVGYMVDGAVGHLEEDKERMVKTPWFDYRIPFSQAAELGTRKVINEHSTVGILIMTDGSIGELSYENYLPAFEKTVGELKKIGKPFTVILNCLRPYGEETKELVRKLEDTYRVSVVPMNCEQMKLEDIRRMMQCLLEEFPVSTICFDIPKWTELLPPEHPVKAKLIDLAQRYLKEYRTMGQQMEPLKAEDLQLIKSVDIKNPDYAVGEVHIDMQLDQTEYYKTVSELTGIPIEGEYQLVHTLFELAAQKEELGKIRDAMSMVSLKGYGVVAPGREEIQLEDPVVIRQGNKFGIRMKATAPSVHLIQADIETEIAPIVGSEEQANDLIQYIRERSSESAEGVWQANIFGKTTEQIVEEGIASKIAQMTEECQKKLQETLQKIINDSKGSMIWIIM